MAAVGPGGHADGRPSGGQCCPERWEQRRFLADSLDENQEKSRLTAISLAQAAAVRALPLRGWPRVLYHRGASQLRPKNQSTEMISKWISSQRRRLRLGQEDALALARVLIGLTLVGAILMCLEHYRGDQLQDRRTGEQAQLLEEMNSLQYPTVSEVVVDWRLAYPEPNDERLAELRDLARQVRTDPSPLLGRAVASGEPLRVGAAHKSFSQQVRADVFPAGTNRQVDP